MNMNEPMGRKRSRTRSDRLESSFRSNSTSSTANTTTYRRTTTRTVRNHVNTRFYVRFIIMNFGFVIILHIVMVLTIIATIIPSSTNIVHAFTSNRISTIHHQQQQQQQHIKWHGATKIRESEISTSSLRLITDTNDRIRKKQFNIQSRAFVNILSAQKGGNNYLEDDGNNSKGNVNGENVSRQQNKQKSTSNGTNSKKKKQSKQNTSKKRTSNVNNTKKSKQNTTIKNESSSSNNSSNSKKKSNNNNNNKSNSTKKKNSSNSKKNNNNNNQKPKPKNKKKNIIQILSNPYEAGVQLRQTIDRTLNLGKKPLTPQQKSIYYFDDRFLETDTSRSDNASGSGGSGSSNSDKSSGSGSIIDASQAAIAFAQRQNDILEEKDELYGLLDDDAEYIPEVLVIGATSSTGQIVVKRLLRSNKFKVRVFVNNLYSNTLNMLGTGVTYCQGELNNMESLEYALTDVDKIVFCESPPQKDELDYQNKFDRFVQDTLTDNGSSSGGMSNDDDDVDGKSMDAKELEIQQLSELMDMKAKIAKQVDFIGMQNVLQAYQNVRHADYGTSQAAKRSLFKFQSRAEDFGLFSISDDDYDDNDIYEQDDDIASDEKEKNKETKNGIRQINIEAKEKYPSYDDYDSMGNYGNYDDDYGKEYDNLDDYNTDDYDGYESKYKNDEDYYSEQYDDYAMNDSSSSSTLKKAVAQNSIIAASSATTMKTQVNWMQNKFNHGVFVGRLPNTSPAAGPNRGTEASIISSRLRSREDPEKGIDLTNGGFAGFICRVCADGKTYEAFVRTSEYEMSGIEYVCKFQAKTKKASQTSNGNKSINKFSTIRLPFSRFTPIKRRQQGGISNKESEAPVGGGNNVFDGNDVKQIGFRIKSLDNLDDTNKITTKGRSTNKNWIPFYLALSYIKVYRSQPEPEFIYFSDARLGEVTDNMINHELKQVIMSGRDQENQSSFDSRNEATTLFDEEEAKRIITNRKDRSEQELYYKYCGEEILKNSGLSYSIIRIPGLNELASGEFSTLRLKQSSKNLTTVSRAEVAAVCESALLDPNARNLCFYLTKTKPGDEAIDIDPNIGLQFVQLKPEI